MWHCLLIPGLACVYAVISNQFFGANWWPQFENEVISDGIFAVLMGLYFLSVQIHRGFECLKKNEDEL